MLESKYLNPSTASCQYAHRPRRKRELFLSRAVFPALASKFVFGLQPSFIRSRMMQSHLLSKLRRALFLPQLAVFVLPGSF